MEVGEWTRIRESRRTQPIYRSLAAMCLRGRFAVTDPARIERVSLSMAFRGAVVVSLNGKEVGRAYMPKEAVRWDTPAEDYERDVFVAPDNLRVLGELLERECASNYVTYPAGAKDLRGSGIAPFLTVDADRYAKRSRRCDMTIPPEALRKGVNVLAIEVHRAPAAEPMFTLWWEGKDCGTPPYRRAHMWWNRLGVEELRLQAAARAPDAVTANTAFAGRPGLWVGNVSVSWPSGGLHPDVNEVVRPMRLRGARNGSFSAQLVVASGEPIKGLRAEATDLTCGDKIIPAAAVGVRFATHSQFLDYWEEWEDLEESAPAEIAAGRTQPVWVTLHVPKTAAPGDYTGKVTIRADQMLPIRVPLQLHVSNWTVPDPKDFVTALGIAQSPDTEAMQYGVPMWSEAHWKLLDKAFRLLGQVGCKRVHIPLVGGERKNTTLGFEHSMVRSIRQANGSYKRDYRIADRYLGLALKHFGRKDLKVAVVCMEGANASKTGSGKAAVFYLTVQDPKTGTLTNVAAPDWRTPECEALLKPLFAGLRDVMKKHGLDERAMYVGYYNAFYGPGAVTEQSSATLAAAMPPGARWFGGGHYWLTWCGKWVPQTKDFAKGPHGHEWGFVWLKSGVTGVFWDPDEDRPVYGWRNPDPIFAFNWNRNYPDYAGSNIRERRQKCFLNYRVIAEGTLLTARAPSKVTEGTWGRGDLSGTWRSKWMGPRGIDHMGANFWPVLKGSGARKTESPLAWLAGFIVFPLSPTWLLAPGKDGPIATIRMEMMRESLQEAEARVFVQNALLDEQKKAKLGADLAARAKALCDERTRMLRNYSEWPFYSGLMTEPVEWTGTRSQQLYDMAAEVANALAAQ